MRGMLLSLLGLACVPALAGEGDRGRLGRVHLAPAPTHDCVPPETRADIQSLLAALPGAEFSGHDRSAGPLYPFFPQAGNWGDDLIPPGFVDHDGGPGFFDYACDPSTSYDGHRGIDSGIRSFDEQAIGVPVYSALDGTVLIAVDGADDQNTFCNGDGNYIIIDHGGGRQAWYFHLKKNSVAVSPGEAVVAGQQIGLTASSGCSFGPHLHFESWQDGQLFDPFAGACGDAQSGWVRQPSHVDSTYLVDFGVTITDLFQVQNGPPHRLPTDAQIPLDHEFSYYWMQFVNIPAGSTWRVRFERPDGSLAYDSGTVTFGNPDPWRSGWTFFYFWIDDMHAIPGAWTFVLDFNGQRMVEAPVEVVVEVDPGFNRPPQPIGAAFDPPLPRAGDVVFARVSGDLLLDDPDWDLVRYRYRWVVDGVVVRDVINAAMSDAIPRDAAARGEIIQCTMTPGDGRADGTPVTVRVAYDCVADCNADGGVNTLDFICFLNRWNERSPAADCNADGSINTQDVICYLNQFTQGACR